MTEAVSQGPPDETPRQPSPGRGELVRAIATHAEGVRRLAAHAERPDLVALIGPGTVQRPDSALTVVVCGEIKRGKSSLLGAIVGRPGIVPVDADVATSAHILIRHGEQVAASLTRLADDGQPSVVPIDPASLVDHVSVAGSDADREGVVGAELVLPHPVLAEGVALVDTPGVGGVGPGHDDVTRAALQRAEVLLFCVSAQQPISRSELDFLAEAASRVGRVAFVLTKSDLVSDDVRDALVAENRQAISALAEGRPELAPLTRSPWVATSSHLAEHALRRRREGHSERAEQAWARSGLPLLEELLVGLARTRTRVRLQQLLRTTDRVLAELDEVQQQRLTALQTGEVAQELARQQEALAALGSTQARWRHGLAAGIGRMQAESARQVTRELTTVRDQYHEALAAVVDPDQLEVLLSQELPRSLLAAWERLGSSARAAFAELVDSLARELGLAIEGSLGELASPTEFGRGPGAPPGEPGQFGLLEDGVPLATQTFLFGGMTNVLAGVLGVATGGLGFLAYGVGAAVSASIVGARRKVRVKQRATHEFQRGLHEALFGVEGVAKEFNTELSVRLLEARAELERAIETTVAERRQELDARRRELTRLAKAEAAERQDAVAAAEADRRHLAQARQHTRELLKRLAPPRSSRGPAPTQPSPP